VKTLLTAEYIYLKIGFKIKHYEEIKKDISRDNYKVAVMYLETDNFEENK